MGKVTLLVWAILFRMVKQLADTFHGRGDYKYSQVVAVRICWDNKITLPFWVIVQHRGPNHHFTICKPHLQLQARRILSLHIKTPFLELRIPMKVPNHKHSLQAFHRYINRRAGGIIGRGQIEEVLIGKEILDKAFGDGSIRISDNHLGRFHFFSGLTLEFVPHMIRNIF
jgi:hypothetical protein